MDLEQAVSEAVKWADDATDLRAPALAALAESLAHDIANPVVMKAGTPPTAALAKELRATLEELEGLRDRFLVVLLFVGWRGDEPDDDGKAREQGKMLHE